jgi:hypothetical protein
MELEKRVGQAVQFFWLTRDRQAAQQGGESGKKDAGSRAAVTGGAQMDGFIRLQRYQLLLTKLVRERLYDSACFLISSREQGALGGYREPDLELSFKSFISSLLGRAVAISGRR